MPAHRTSRRRSQTRQLAASAAVLGLAALLAGAGTYAGFTASAAESQSFSSGTASGGHAPGVGT